MTGAYTKPAEEIARAARAASHAVGIATRATKDAFLLTLADRLEQEQTQVLAANALDVEKAQGSAAAFVDRLTLTRARIKQIADATRAIAELPDPVGHKSDERTLPNGLIVYRTRVPLGVVAIVYESRPNVTIDAAALCIKSGNACILRGGSEAFETNQAFGNLVRESLVAVGLPPEAVSVLQSTDRELLLELLKQEAHIDLVIPRGGEGLIRFVAEASRIPVIRHYKGVCHVFVDDDADLAMAERIVLNAKTHRPGVCNALETLLVAKSRAADFLPGMARALVAKGVELHGDEATCAILQGSAITSATDADWDTEYLDLILAVRVVEDLDAAIEHVRRHGTQHTESIITANGEHAERWLREIDASMVLVNASTRFNDGGSLGLGAEIGISTTKLHAYGAMGLEELCTRKWVGVGTGQIRD